jgi:hypothetical protein
MSELLKCVGASTIVAELQLYAEILFPKQSDGILEVVA